MIGLILSFLMLGVAIYFDGFIAPYAVSVIFNFLFWWYVIISAPKFLFVMLFIFLASVIGATAIVDVARSRIGKFFGFGATGLALGGVSIIACCIFVLGPNIFFILGAYLIYNSIYVDLLLSSGSHYHYDYGQVVLGVIAIILGLYLQRGWPISTTKTRT